MSTEKNLQAGANPPSLEPVQAYPIEAEDFGQGKKRRKRKHSKNMKGPARLERGVTKALARVANAFAGGVDTYRKKSNKSSRKKRDGAVRDALKNWTSSLGKAVRKSSKASNDVAKSVESKPWRRLIRRANPFSR